MRYLLLILTLTSVCYSADAEVDKILKQFEAERSALHQKVIDELKQYKDKNYQPIKAILPPADPKESEKRLANLVNSYNNQISRFGEILEAGHRNQEAIHVLGRILGELKDVKANLISMGAINNEAVVQRDEPAVSETTKPKEKKKITAVLADGTKIER